MSEITIDQVVRAKEAAELCGLQLRSFLYHVRKKQGPPPLVVMGKKCYLRADVLSWQAAREEEANNRKGKP